MTARRFVALFNGLGVGSACHRAIDPDAWYWRPEHELLATVAEAVDAGTRTFIAAHSKEGSRAPKPLQITRPYGAHKRTRGTTLDEFTKMFNL